MKFYMKGTRNNIDAVAEFNLEDNSMIVLKGSKVSDTVSSCKTFRGATVVERQREEFVNADFIVIKDVKFKSPSTAANFVSGSSTNGRRAWKDKNGHTIKQIEGA